MSLSEGPIVLLGDPSIGSQLASEVPERPVLTDSRNVDTDTALLVTIGPEALAEALSLSTSPPILPLGIPETSHESTAEVSTLVATAIAGTPSIRDRRVLTIRCGDIACPILYDATVMTGEPARISEYRIFTGPEDRELTQVRADGIVGATPLGTEDYARRTGGPLVTPGVPAVSVVPVAPFRIAKDAYVVQPPVTISLERDEGTVELFGDGRQLATLRRDRPVTITDRGTAPVLMPEEKT